METGSLTTKPWGKEYLLYQNDNVELWHLFIKYGEQTSLHAHPNKKTGLIVVNGQCKLEFINSHKFMETGDKIVIRNGVFHRTTSFTYPYLELLEIETPKDKNDIIRLEDNYGRAGLPYEDSQYEFGLVTNSNEIGKCDKEMYHILSDGVGWADIEDYMQVVVLGGHMFSNGYFVLSPGDIIDGKNFKRLSNKFEKTDMELMLIYKNRT